MTYRRDQKCCQPKNLIAGFGTNQEAERIRVFLESARESHPVDSCIVALITNDITGLEDIIEQTESVVIQTTNNYSPSTGNMSKALNRFFIHGLRLMNYRGFAKNVPEITQGYRVLLETWHHPQLARWLAYERILQFLTNVDQIILADVKDVVFQAPCFGNWLENKVVAVKGVEDFTANTWNGRWYAQAYGETARRKIEHELAICIGIVLGDRRKLLPLIKDFVDEISRSPFGKIEQAIFNQMIIEKKFSCDIDLLNNGDGPAVHLGGFKDEQVLIKDGLLADPTTGRVWPIAHMYDRIPIAKQVVLHRSFDADGQRR